MLVVGQDCGAHKVGEFYDTIAASPCTVRFKTADIGQVSILSNEDTMFSHLLFPNVSTYLSFDDDNR